MAELGQENENDSQSIRVVLKGGSPWGFSLKGGSEHHCPLTIAKVEVSGKANLSGQIKVDDVLVSINGVTCVSHAEAVQHVRRARKELVLQVLRVPSEFPCNDRTTELHKQDQSAELYKRVKEIHEKESVMFMQQQQPQTEPPVKGPLFGAKRNKKKEGNPAPAPRPKSWHNPGALNSFRQNSDTQKQQPDSTVPQHNKPGSISVIRIDEEKPNMNYRRSSGTFTQNQERNRSFKSAKSLSNLNSNTYESENRHPGSRYGMVKKFASQIDMNVTTKPNYSGTGQDYVQVDNLTMGTIHSSYNPKFRSGHELEPADVYPKKVVSKQISRDKAIAFVGTIPDKSDVQNGSYHPPHGQDYYIRKSQVYAPSHTNNNLTSGTVQMPVRQIAMGIDPLEFQKQRMQKDSDTPSYKYDRDRDYVYVQNKAVVYVDRNPPPPPIRDGSSLPKPNVISDHVKSSSWPVHTGPNIQADNNATTKNNTITSDSLPPVKLLREPERFVPNEQQTNEPYNIRKTSKVSPKSETTVTKEDANSGLFTATLCEVRTDESGPSDKLYENENENSRRYDYKAYNVPSPPTRDTDVDPWTANSNQNIRQELDVLPKTTLSNTLSSENLVNTYKNYLEQSLLNDDVSPERMDRTRVYEPQIHMSNKVEENTYPGMKKSFSTTSSHSRKPSDIVRPVSPMQVQNQTNLKHSMPVSENEANRTERRSGSLDEGEPGRYWKSPDDHTKEEKWKHLVETADAQYKKVNGSSKNVKEESSPTVPAVSSRVRSPISSKMYEEDFEQTLQGRSNSDVFVDDPPKTNFGAVTEDFTKRHLYRQQPVESNNLNCTAPAGESNFSTSDWTKLRNSSSSSILSQLQRDHMPPTSSDRQTSPNYSSTKDYHREDVSRSEYQRYSPSNNSKNDTMYQDLLSSVDNKMPGRQERHHQDSFHGQTNEDDYSQQLKAVQQKVLQQTSYPPLRSPRHSDSSSSSNSSSRRSSHFSMDSDSGGQPRFRGSETDLYKRNPTDPERSNRSHRFSDPKKYRKQQFDNVKGEHQHSKSDSERHNKPYNNMQGHKYSDPSGAIPKSQRLSDPQASRLHAQDTRHDFYMTPKHKSMGSLNSLRSTSSGSRQGSISDQMVSPGGSNHSKSSSMSSSRHSYSHSGHLSSASSTSSLSPSPKPQSPTTVGGKGNGVTMPIYGQRTFSYRPPDVITKGRASIGSYIPNNEDRPSKGAPIRRSHSAILQTPVKGKPLEQLSNEQRGIDCMENLRNRPQHGDTKSGFPFRVEEPSDWSGVRYQTQPTKPVITPLEKTETSHQTILETEEEIHDVGAKTEIKKHITSPVFKFPDTGIPSPNIISSNARRDEDSDGSGPSSDTPDIIVGTEQKEFRSRLNIDKARSNTTDSFILPSPPATPIDTDVPFGDLPPPPPEVLEDKSQIPDMALPPPPSPEDARNHLNRMDSLEGNQSTNQFTEQDNNKLQRSSSEVVGNSHRFNRPSEDGGDYKTSPSITPSLSPSSDVSISPSLTKEFTANGIFKQEPISTNGHNVNGQGDSNINCINRKLSSTTPPQHPRLSSLERWKERRAHENDKHSEELKNTIVGSCNDSELIRLLSTEVSAEPYIMEIFPDMSNGFVRNHVSQSGDGPPSPERIPTSPIPALSPTSQYYISTSKALLMKKASEEIEGNSVQIDTQELNKKKEELINSISKKLEALKLELHELDEDKKKNDELGNEVTEVVKKVCERREIRKYNQYIEEQSKIIDLLLSLSGRLARAENALSTAEAECDDDQKMSLHQLLTKLRQQYDDAKTLKCSVEKKSRTVSAFLKTNLNSDQYQDYEYFIKTKSNLTWMSREFNDKIKLGEEQLQALRGSMLRSDKSDKVL